MTDTYENEVDRKIALIALENAERYGGTANPGSVASTAIPAIPELKENAGKAFPRIRSIVEGINSMSSEERTDLRSSLEGEFQEGVTFDGGRGERGEGLPELPNVGADGVVMRFAPGPSGPLHIGHTRAAILNDEYVKRYGGRFITRLEDTNPEAILPEAYEMIPEELGWLGVEVHETVVQSDRFPIYLEHGRRMVEIGGGYICTCDSEEWRELKAASKPCPHRDTGIDENLEQWERMLSGGFAPGEATMIIRTDLEHRNPAVRDFPAFRIVEHPHPRTKDEFQVYPLYNFSVVIDDHLMGITHVLRGKDHLNNTKRQRYVFEHFGWDEPEFIHYGWVKIEDALTKTSTIKEAISAGTFSGWYDVRLATLKGLARRGISPEAIRKYWIEVGTKAVDIRFSWENLYAYAREIVDPKALRYFFVQEPRGVAITGADSLQGAAPRHPGDPSLGEREYELVSKDGVIDILVPAGEVWDAGTVLRLKDLCNIRATGPGTAEYVDDDIATLKDAGGIIIQWAGVPGIRTRLEHPDGSLLEGFCEPEVADLLSGRTVIGPIGPVNGAVLVQFERVGYYNVWLDKDGDEEMIVGAFAHS